MAAVRAGRQVVRGTGFALRDPWPWPVFAGLARDGERLGYRAVLLPEIAGRDAFAAATALAGETSTLMLGTGVVPMTSRRAMLTAMAAATVQERSAGRAILGVGAGAPSSGALSRLRDHVLQLWSLLDSRDLGDDGLTLEFEGHVPIWIAALGPRAVALAGEVADGVLLNWCSPERVAEAREGIRQAAEAVGRDPDEITVAAYVRAAVDDDRDRALAALTVAASEYASYPAYRRQFEAMGLGDAAAAAASTLRPTEGSALDPATIDAARPLIEGVCLAGDVAEARTRLEAYRHAGCDLPVVYPVPVPRTLSDVGSGPGEGVADDRASSVATTLAALAP